MCVERGGFRLELLVLEGEIWYLDYFQFVKFGVEVHFFCFRPSFVSFVEIIHSIIHIS